ncbi:casein kinase II subunit beta [Rhizoctonia solani]|uniref:Multifunctional fusion protein n=1 Tax=Rhizoctonia solani TaxID=456999 RepID=A0A8H8SSC1_9AGAM|nr:casein kinase II subunit beta [Rhizoctonia solani]QRW15839.1 casein kinase II subunit beta [Rhizoctonia solani]
MSRLPSGIPGQTPQELGQEGNPVEDDAMNDDQAEQEGYASSTPTSSLTWITWFCSLPGHEYFCEVGEDFIEDDFNLTGLNGLVPFWREAMEMVLDVEPEDALKIPDVSIVESSAELLYGLVHQRYILTRPGLQAMVEKYEAGHFGTCPRVFCNSCHVVPCGRSDLPGLETVKLYCPNCNDIYSPPSSRFQGVDGAFFGTTFPHLLFQTYRELAPAPFSPTAPPVDSVPSRRQPAIVEPFVNPNPHGGQKQPADRVYTSKIYGFRVSERARSGPRMRWLRLRPQGLEELNAVDWRGRWIGSDDDGGFEDSDREGGPLERFDDDEGSQEDEEEEEEEEEEKQQAAPNPGARLGRQHNLLASDWKPYVDPALATNVAGLSSYPTAQSKLEPYTIPEDSDAPRSTLSRSSSSSSLSTPAEDTLPRPQAYRKPKGALNRKFQEVEMMLRAAAGTGTIEVVENTAPVVAVTEFGSDSDVRHQQSTIDSVKPQDPMAVQRTNLRYGANTGRPTTAIDKVPKPSHRKGALSAKNKLVRSVVREVAGFAPYERRVMELLRNSKDKKARKLTKKRLGTLLRSKRKLEELSSIIQESRRAH